MQLTRRARFAALVAGLGLGACSSGGNGGGTDSHASLSVSLMDGPVEDVTQVHLKIEHIWLKPTNGAATELTLAGGPIGVDLLGLTDQNAALLVDQAPIAPGSYEWLRMDVSANFDGSYDSYVLTKAGGQEPLQLRVPSGSVRLVDGFDVGPNQAVKFLFDWNLRKALVRPPGQPGYFLKPAFRMLDVTELGVLSGTVDMTSVMAAKDGMTDPNGCLADDPNDLDVGNVVYVFAGSDVTPDDIDGVDDPVATADVAQNDSGDYVYRTVLAPGDYTVAFTCQAGNDNPEVDESTTTTPGPLVFLLPAVNVTVTADTPSTVNF